MARTSWVWPHWGAPEDEPEDDDEDVPPDDDDEAPPLEPLDSMET